MASRIISNDGTQQKAELLMDELEEKRMEGLQNAEIYQQIKQKQLESEMIRLTEKGGANSARVQKINARLEYNKKYFEAMDMQVALTKRTAETYDPDTWRVQGMVSDDQNIPMPSLTVQLSSGDKGINNNNNNVFSSVTDASGFYSITVSNDILTGAKEIRLFLLVLDANGNQLFQDPRTLIPAAGTIDIEDIIIPNQTPVPVKKAARGGK